MFRGDRLPYVDNLVNILVVHSSAALQQRGLSRREVARVLAPLGTAYLGVAEAAASRAIGLASWTDWGSNGSRRRRPAIG